MNIPRLALVAAAAAVVTACSPSGNPQLDMCKKITSNIIIGDAEFGEIQETKGKLEMKMVLPYTSDGQSSEAVCTFAADTVEGTYQTSPKAMTIDGMQIGTKDLMKASLASSKIVLKETADETKKQAAAAAEDAKVMANEAKDKATELAGEAKVKAAELTEEAKIKADEMATKIKESEALEKAKLMADEAKEKAKAAIVEGAKNVQQKLEN